MDAILTLQFAFLGALQGFTEPLPISSSGHLLIVQELFNLQIPGLSFETFVNFGSLIAIIIFFWHDLAKILSGVIKFNHFYLKYLLKIIISTLPIVIVGLFLFLFSEFAFFETLSLVGFALIITGALLWYISKKPEGSKEISDLTYLESFFIGCGQALAIIPGISRSGMTMVFGIFVGLKHEAAFNFSFIMYIPASIGATILSIILLKNDPEIISLLPYYIESFTIAIGTTWLGLLLLRKLVVINKLFYFSIYCFIVGFFIIIYSFFV